MLTNKQIDKVLSRIAPSWWDVPAAATYDFARAIEAKVRKDDEAARRKLAAATATKPAPASQGDALDAARLDWLDQNIFLREMSERDAKYGHGSAYNMWVLFAPKGAQSSARNIIDAARAAQEGK